MNPLEIEKELARVIQITFTNEEVLTGTSSTVLEPDSLNFVVSVMDLQHIGGNLYKANTDIKLTAPALDLESGYTEYTGVLSTLAGILTNDYFTTNWTTTAGKPAYAGIWVADKKTSFENKEWVTNITLVVGINGTI